MFFNFNNVLSELEKNIELSSLDNSIYNFLEKSYKSNTGRPPKLGFHDILYCINMKRKYCCDTWIGLWRCMKDMNLELPNYSNFLKSMKRLTVFLLILINFKVDLNKKEFLQKAIRIAFVDSTFLAVCDLKRSSRHKIMVEAQLPPNYSKCTMGYYYGYKLNITIDYESKKVIDYEFSNSKQDDRIYLAKIMLNQNKFLNSKTLFVTDKGYQAQWLETLARQTNNYFISGKKKSKNIRTLASQFDMFLIHVRARVETIFSNLKMNCFLTSTRSRSVLGYIFTYVSSMYYCLFNKI